jgi:hypothetical protein
MNRTTVSSTSLVSVGYDEQNEILEVEFNGGRTYQYHGVPNQVYRNLMSAASHGSYFDQNIKKAGYSFGRVG